MQPNAMADCVFPEDIMVCILTRVPVISIIRFKSVCKPWLHLFSTPEFVKMHHRQFSIDPKNQLFIVQKTNRDFSRTLSLLNAEKKKHTTLDHPFSSTAYASILIVGCCNGLFCIKRGPLIALWNPATNLSKEISSTGSWIRNCKASLGFGYDAVGSDYKVVRIVLEGRIQGGLSARVVGVEVYSVVSDSWTTIVDVGFQFYVSWKGTNDVIVNGNPYWRAEIDGNMLLLGFDVKELVFKVLPVYREDKKAEFMFDYNGCLGAVVCNIVGKPLVESLDVWVFDDGARIWRKDRTYNRAIKACVDRVLQISKSGMVLGVRPNGKVCVFCLETGRDKKFQYAVQRARPLDVFGYTESLAYVRGMEQVNLRSGRHFGRNWL